MEDIETLDLLGTPLMEGYNLITMLLRFSFNMLVVWLMIHCLYYPKSGRRDYYFTFMLISISIFFLIFLLGGVKLKIGFALGLFAIFGIIRYRTESMPVREMTYLFCIIAISVINALAITISYIELLVTNVIFLLAAWFFESYILLKHVSTKLITDLEHRTGLKINSVEIGAIDFLRDMAIVKIYYETDHVGDNSINNELKLSREEWTDVGRQ